MDALITSHRGRIANTAGDSVLAEFGSVVDAAQCAVEVQTALATANDEVASERRINFRIGVHVGDVMVKSGDLFGDGVNIAARLQTLASAGGICISGAAHDHVRKILPLSFTDLGSHSMKNIDEPVRAYAIGAVDASVASSSSSVSRFSNRPLQLPAPEPSAEQVRDAVAPCPSCGGAMVVLGVLARPAPCRTSVWDDTS